MVSDITTRRLIRRVIGAFIAWRHRRRVARALPEINQLQRMILEHQRLHKPVKPLLRQRTAIVHERLRIENERKAA